MDDFFRSQQSPRGDSQINMSAFVSPQRNVPQLPRRFTTDSGRVPTLSSITNMRGPESRESNATEYKVQLLEKKKAEYERLREQKRRFEAEMHKLDQQQRDEEQELAKLAIDLSRYGPGHQSEPTTPPEYRDGFGGFPSMFSRPNRYSTSSLTSPMSYLNRPGRSGSQLTSPPPGLLQSQSRFVFEEQLPSRSTPASRRNSDEDEKDEAVRQDPTSHRSTNATNRYSMPVTRSRSYRDDHDHTLDGNGTARFLFGDEDSGDKNYQATNHNDVYQAMRGSSGYNNMLSATSSALDSAQGQAIADNTSTNGWGSIHRHRHQQSLSAIGSGHVANNSTVSSGPGSDVSTIGTRTPRHSIDLKSYQVASPVASEFSGATSAVSPSAATHGNMSTITTTVPKLQQSYSSNEVPTLKSNNGPVSPNANNHAQQHFHNHNLNSGRYPTGAQPNNRHSREMSNETNTMATASRDTSTYGSINSTLHASAAPFGPVNPQVTQPGAMHGIPVGPYAPNPYQFYPAPYGGTPYGIPQNGMGANGMNYNGVGALTMSMQNHGLNGNLNGNGSQQMYQPPQGYQAYGHNQAPYGGQMTTRPERERDSQARVIQTRRNMDNEVMNRYSQMTLQSAIGQIYELCKDQHGCRFLQKQLESRDPQVVHTVWLETNQHVVELMIDPFGNYLCQKLLEYCNDEERTELIKNAAKEMIRIALNQHGTRALQKMIEYVSTNEQVEIIVNALRDQVCALIEDLNGNHVIQKCLNKLSSPQATFIFEAVGNNCLEVGTHRHGCCVMQRCIDHATGDQRDWLIQKITESAVSLVQDPFGNYVIQYIIDLDEPQYTEPIVHTMFGRIFELSKLKFSSNVIEKCLRCAKDPSKDLICDELVTQMDLLLRDNFGNYVVQTAVDYATPARKQALLEAIRPLLPGCRSTPYGRRLQNRLTQFDNMMASRPHGSTALQLIRDTQVTPTDESQGQITSRPPHGRVVGTTQQSIIGSASPQTNGANSSSPQGSSTAQGSVNGNASGTSAETNGTATNGSLTPTHSVNGYTNGSVTSLVTPPHVQGQRTQKQADPRQYTPQHQQFQTPGPNGTEGTQHWV